MSIGAFTDRNHCPTEAEMNASVGPMLEEWNALGQWIHSTYRVQEDLHFMYGPKYGWAQRFRAGGALLGCLYPVEAGFTAQVILNPEALRRAEKLNLRKNTREAIARAHPYPEGKWLFVYVANHGDVEDVERLLQLKRESQLKRRATGSRPAV